MRPISWLSGGIGRHERLKISWKVTSVRVRVPPQPLFFSLPFSRAEVVKTLGSNKKRLQSLGLACTSCLYCRAHSLSRLARLFQSRSIVLN